MPPLSFLAVEAICFVMTGFIIREAWRKGLHSFGALLASMLFGLAIEFYFVTLYQGYSYGDFLVDFPAFGHQVPVWVACGWGTIIWASMQASDRMRVPWAVRPTIDGLLAVSIDLTLDPIADHLGWWSWSREAQFFGVPCDNFIGWVLIVSSFSFFTRLGFHWLKPGVWWRDLLLPGIAVLPSVLFMAGAQLVLEKLYPLFGEPFVFLSLSALYLMLMFPFTWVADAEEEVPWYLTGLPAIYHGLSVVHLLLSTIPEEDPALLVVVPVAALLSLGAFRYPRRSSHADAQA